MNKQLIVKQQSRLKTLIFCWCKEEHYHCAMILSAPFTFYVTRAAAKIQQICKQCKKSAIKIQIISEYIW